MMSSFHALRDRARRLLAAGKHARAAEAYEALAERETTNPRWPQKAGQAYRRLGEEKKAVVAFSRAAGLYAEQGFLLKAVALCKLILGLDPAHEATQEMLAELYARRDSQSPKKATSGAPGGVPTDEVAEVAEVAEVPEVDDVALVAAGESLDTIDLSLVIEALPPERRAEIEGLRPPPQTREGVLELNLDDLEAIDEAFEAIEAPDSADRILDRMPPTPLFSSLDRGALRMLIEEVDVRFFGPGERIIRSGSGGTSLFVLVEGAVVVWREGPPRVEIGRLDEGAFFGEIALLTQRARTATVEALGECTILEISRRVVGKLVLKHPGMLRVMLRFFRERLVDGLVDTHALFAPFAGPDREALARRFSFIEARRGTVLAREGEPADGLYIVLAGAVRAHREGGATTLLGPGDLFGETSLLTEEHAVATVTVDEKCWLLRMDRAVFRETIMTHPHVLAVLADVSAQRVAARKNALAGGGLDETRIPIL